MNKMITKSAMALAIAAASMAATAANLTTTGPVVLANEVFGTGSEETLVAIPEVTFEVTNASGVIAAASNTYTVKFTLNKDAVFGEDLSSLDKWEDAGVVLTFETSAGVIAVGGVGAGNTALNADVTSITVDQGGAIGDNTVTFKITAAQAHTFEQAVVSQFRVKRLTSALKRGVANPTVSFGAEFRNVTAGTTDTDTAEVIFRSQDGVALDGTLTSYKAAGGRARIDVADTELSFTGSGAGQTGANAAQDFDETNNVSFVSLGTLAVVRTEVGAGPDLVKKENADDFDFNGSDEIKVTLSSTQKLDAYSKLYLRPVANGACDGTVVGTDFDVTPTAGNMSAEIDLSGETTVALGNGYNVCAVAGGTKAIPESTFSAELNVNYFNPRYTNSEDTFSYDAILRNGCQVTLFNLPSVGASDDAFIRITNVSEKPGAVRVSVWPEAGGSTTIDTNTVVFDSLAAHATAVLHTNADIATSGNGVYLGDKLPAYSALASGRHRLIIQGAFPACEALGLVRASNGQGPLTNMTSTTYSGDETRLGTNNNGTSNTTN